MGTTLVSIVVPIFNGAPFVASCCEQLADQTYRPIEVILVDDGSDDGTAELCDDMRGRFDFCRVVHQPNRGVSCARNAGISAARGDYVAFVDVDDRVAKDMVEYELNLALKTNADMVCLGVSGAGECDLVNSDEATDMLLRASISMSSWNKLFKKELIAAGPFPAGIRVYEDLLMVYRCLANAERIACSNEEKYEYVHREGSSSRSETFSRKYFDAVKVVDGICTDVRDKRPHLQRSAELRRALAYLRISKIFYLRGAPSDCQDEIDRMRNYLQAFSRDRVKSEFKKTEQIRYYLYLYARPVFGLMLKTVDKG